MLTIQVAPDITLVALQASHAPRLFELIDGGRAYLRRWQNWPDYIRTLQDVHDLIERSDFKLSHNNGFDLAIVQDGEIVGKVGLVYVNQDANLTEIGYWMGQGYQGRGTMTRSVDALTAYALDTMGLNEVRIRCAVGNTRSRAIPERLYFAYQGILPRKTWLHGQKIEEVLYTMDTRRWERLHQRRLNYSAKP